MKSAVKSLAAGLVAASLLHGAAFAQEPKISPTDRILTAAAANSLNDIQEHPWHIKVNITAFDDGGANPQTGTVEMWRAGKNSRSIYTFGNTVAERMTVGDVTYRSFPWPEIPYRTFQMMDEILNPGPEPGDVTSSKPDFRKQSFGKVSLDCVMLSRPTVSGTVIPLGLFPTYCMEPDNGMILLKYNLGGEVVSVQAAGKFLDHQIPMKLTLAEGKTTMATASVATLSTYQPAPDEFVPGPGMKTGSGEARVSGGVIAANILTKVPPVYPQSAKVKHVGGTVLLHAIIGRDGHIHALRPISSPDPDLTLSAIIAVRQWTYKPYLLNGEPTEVDTTITINFNLN